MQIGYRIARCSETASNSNEHKTIVRLYIMVNLLSINGSLRNILADIGLQLLMYVSRECMFVLITKLLCFNISTLVIITTYKNDSRF